MILSVSRRTDIPAFYSEWFYRRINEGYVYVRNPMNCHQVSRISLSPEVVDCIVFWSKNPEPMLSRLGELDGYSYYFQYSVNAYGQETEPRVPPLERRIETFKALADKLGSERVIWRYDPILFTEKYSVQFHLDMFAQIAAALKGLTSKCVFSFVDIYPTKNKDNLRRLKLVSVTDNEMHMLIEGMTSIAAENGLSLATCAEKVDLSHYGISHNSCIDRELIERITGAKLKVGADGQREGCGCVKCEDIGAYDTCLHGCVYCYANYRPGIVEGKYGRLDNASPLLCDAVDPAFDKITERKVRSYKQPGDPFGQMSLF